LGETFTADELMKKSSACAAMFMICDTVRKYVIFADAELRAEIESLPAP
jgi:hypothetical protein